MLKTCPECEQSVSEKAYTCPHCGFPLKEPATKKKKTAKRRRLPNGFGQITKISGRNLKNPYRAMVTVGKDDLGKPISKLLKPRAYFQSYNDAYNALVEYNKDPFDISESITMNDLFQRWIVDHSSAGNRSKKNIKCAWQYCEQIYSIKVQSLRARHIKQLFLHPYKTVNDEKIAAGPASSALLKSIMNQLCDFAISLDLMTRNYARENAITIDHQEKHHKSFTQEEMDSMWRHSDNKYTAMILFQCYMGWRPSEMLSIKRENVNLNDMYIIGGLKTKAGINRMVPIHSKIKEIFFRFWNFSSGSEWLFPSPINKDNHLTYNGYTNYFNSVIDLCALESGHRPHDCRKHFVTMAKAAYVDEYAIKRIVGHSIKDITENTYTDRSIEWLKSEIEKIK